MNQPTPEELRNATFTINRLLPGYDIPEVDSFLRAAADRVRAGWPAIDPHNEPDFHIRWKGNGYDIKEVDDFFAPMYPAPGNDPPVRPRSPVTVEQVRNATFTKARFQSGYSVAEVDSFLRAASDRMAAGQSPIDPFNAPTFSLTRFGECYDEHEVDEFLNLLYSAHDGNPADTSDTIPGEPVTVEKIRNAFFTPTRLRPGYRQNEVDELLDKVEKRVAAGLPPIAPEQNITFNITRLGEGYDEQEVDAFLNVLYKASGMPPR